MSMSANEKRWLKEHAEKFRKSEEWVRDAETRHAAGEPFAYILGLWAFRSEDYAVGPGVLIPRPETEELVDVALKKLKDLVHRFGSLNIVDAGAGSGCIGLSFLLESARRIAKDFVGRDITLRLHLVEKSLEAQKYLKKNIDYIREVMRIEGLPKAPLKIEIENHEQSWTAFRSHEQIHVLLSNPPYITGAEGDQADENVKSFEPKGALYPEDLEKFPDASGPYRELLRLADKMGTSGTCVFFELGLKQPDWILDYVARDLPNLAPGACVENDMAGKPRFFIAEKRM